MSMYDDANNFKSGLIEEVDNNLTKIQDLSVSYSEGIGKLLNILNSMHIASKDANHRVYDEIENSGSILSKITKTNGTNGLFTGLVKKLKSKISGIEIFLQKFRTLQLQDSEALTLNLQSQYYAIILERNRLKKMIYSISQVSNNLKMLKSTKKTITIPTPITASMLEIYLEYNSFIMNPPSGSNSVIVSSWTYSSNNIKLILKKYYSNLTKKNVTANNQEITVITTCISNILNLNDLSLKDGFSISTLNTALANRSISDFKKMDYEIGVVLDNFLLLSKDFHKRTNNNNITSTTTNSTPVPQTPFEKYKWPLIEPKNLPSENFFKNLFTNSGMGSGSNGHFNELSINTFNMGGYSIKAGNDFQKSFIIQPNYKCVGDYCGMGGASTSKMSNGEIANKIKEVLGECLGLLKTLESKSVADLSFSATQIESLIADSNNISKLRSNSETLKIIYTARDLKRTNLKLGTFVAKFPESISNVCRDIYIFFEKTIDTVPKNNINIIEPFFNDFNIALKMQYVKNIAKMYQNKYQLGKTSKRLFLAKYNNFNVGLQFTQEAYDKNDEAMKLRNIFTETQDIDGNTCFSMIYEKENVLKSQIHTLEIAKIQSSIDKITNVGVNLTEFITTCNSFSPNILEIIYQSIKNGPLKNSELQFPFANNPGNTNILGQDLREALSKFVPHYAKAVYNVKLKAGFFSSKKNSIRIMTSTTVNITSAQISGENRGIKNFMLKGFNPDEHCLNLLNTTNIFLDDPPLISFTQAEASQYVDSLMDTTPNVLVDKTTSFNLDDNTMEPALFRFLGWLKYGENKSFHRYAAGLTSWLQRHIDIHYNNQPNNMTMMGYDEKTSNPIYDTSLDKNYSFNNPCGTLATIGLDLYKLNINVTLTDILYQKIIDIFLYSDVPYCFVQFFNAGFSDDKIITNDKRIYFNDTKFYNFNILKDLIYQLQEILGKDTKTIPPDVINTVNTNIKNKIDKYTKDIDKLTDISLYPTQIKLFTKPISTFESIVEHLASVNADDILTQSESNFEIQVSGPSGVGKSVSLQGISDDHGNIIKEGFIHLLPDANMYIYEYYNSSLFFIESIRDCLKSPLILRYKDILNFKNDYKNCIDYLDTFSIDNGSVKITEMQQSYSKKQKEIEKFKSDIFFVMKTDNNSNSSRCITINTILSNGDSSTLKNIVDTPGIENPFTLHGGSLNDFEKNFILNPISGLWSMLSNYIAKNFGPTKFNSDPNIYDISTQYNATYNLITNIAYLFDINIHNKDHLELVRDINEDYLDLNAKYKYTRVILTNKYGKITNSVFSMPNLHGLTANNEFNFNIIGKPIPHGRHITNSDSSKMITKNITDYFSKINYITEDILTKMYLPSMSSNAGFVTLINTIFNSDELAFANYIGDIYSIKKTSTVNFKIKDHLIERFENIFKYSDIFSKKIHTKSPIQELFSVGEEHTINSLFGIDEIKRVYFKIFKKEMKSFYDLVKFLYTGSFIPNLDQKICISKKGLVSSGYSDYIGTQNNYKQAAPFSVFNINGKSQFAVNSHIGIVCGLFSYLLYYLIFEDKDVLHIPYSIRLMWYVAVVTFYFKITLEPGNNNNNSNLNFNLPTLNRLNFRQIVSLFESPIINELNVHKTDKEISKTNSTTFGDIIYNAFLDNKEICTASTNDTYSNLLQNPTCSPIFYYFTDPEVCEVRLQDFNGNNYQKRIVNLEYSELAKWNQDPTLLKITTKDFIKENKPFLSDTTIFDILVLNSNKIINEPIDKAASSYYKILYGGKCS